MFLFASNYDGLCDGLCCWRGAGEKEEEEREKLPKTICRRREKVLRV